MYWRSWKSGISGRHPRTAGTAGLRHGREINACARNLIDYARDIPATPRPRGRPKSNTGRL